MAESFSVIDFLNYPAVVLPVASPPQLQEIAGLLPEVKIDSLRRFFLLLGMYIDQGAILTHCTIQLLDVERSLCKANTHVNSIFVTLV